jgi:TonB-linked SusC/RagA family outer membrane protein
MNYLFKLTLTAVTIVVSSLQIQAQTKVVKGTVKDSKTKENLPGVTIVVPKTTIGVASDENGNFTITVPDSIKNVVVSSLGFTTKVVTISGESLNITLDADGILLKEMVVTALGVTKEKKALGYNVSEVSGADLSRSGESNVIQGLASKASGIQVISSSGTPGASSKIIIRGASTFGENQPLIVVDGIPVDNSTTGASAGDNPFNANLQGVSNSNRALDINPDDIESVTILKGPSAAALYGARAGNGAILYTTKKGKYGKKGLGITFSSSVELSKVNKLPAMQNKYAAGIDGVTYIKPADPGPDQLFDTKDDISNGTNNSWGPTLASQGLKANDNNGNFFKTGVTYNNNLAIDGGNDKTIYRFSYSNYKNDGVIPNTWMKRNTVRLNAEHKLSEKLKVGTSISYANTQTQKPQNGSNLTGVMLGLMRMPVSYDIRDYQYTETGNVKTYYGTYDNPLYSVNKNTYNDNVNRVYGNTYINYKPYSWLDVNYKIGLDQYSQSSLQKFAISSIGDDNNLRYGQMNFDTKTSMQIYSDLLLTARKTFKEKWNTSLTIGNNIWHNKTTDVFSRGRNMAVPDVYNLNNSIERYASNNTYEARTYALFFDGSIDYKSAIFLGLTGRNEWSSAYDPQKRSYFYPAANTSIVISELIKLPKWFSFAKIRAAYANVGLPPTSYQNKTYYVQSGFTDGFTNGNSFPYLGNIGYGLNNNLGNPILKPEKKRGFEYGAEVKFFNGRLNLDVTYYDQTSTDVLLYRPIAPSSGAAALYSNSASISNKGWEVAFSATPIDKPNFKWDINITWYRNVSKVLKLADGVNEFNIEQGFDGIGAYAIVGQPFGAFYGQDYQKTASGKLIIDPTSGLPYIDPINKNLGNSQPDWLSGIRNSFTYKNFSFTFLWDFRKGGKIWNGTKARMNSLGTSKESEDREHPYTIDGVYSTGVNADGTQSYGSTANTTTITAKDYYRKYLGDPAFGGVAATAIEDGSWIRLREVALSYRINIKNKKYIQYIDLSISGRNVLLFTKYSGVDPETSLTGAGSNLTGYDYFNNPGTKSIFFGLKAGF